MMDDANHSLKDSKKILKAFFNSTQSVIFLFDTENKILFFNKNAYESCMKFFQKKCKIGESFIDLFPDALLQEKHIFKREFEKALKGKVIASERKIKCTDDQTFWIRSEYNPIYDEDELIGVALTITNINERKEHESYIRQQNRTLAAISFIQSHKTRQPLATLLGLISILDKSSLTEYNNKIINLMEGTANELDSIIRSTIIKASSVFKDKL